MSDTFTFNINVDDPLMSNMAANNVPNLAWYIPVGPPPASISQYNYDIYNLLFSAELNSSWENGGGSADPYGSPYSTVTYVDGDPTIGVGIDLWATPGALTLFFGLNTSNPQQEQEIEALSRHYASPTVYNNGLTAAGAIGFTINSTQSQEVFEYYEGIKGEAQGDKYLTVENAQTGAAEAIPDSTMRMALVDMEYNGGFISPAKSPTLLKDFSTGNRSDAWFQIAFNSNGYKGTGPGTSGANAARRWEDASLFGLYDGSQTTSGQLVTQALSIYGTLSERTNGSDRSGGLDLTNRAFAFAYSQAYKTNISSVASTNVNLNLYALTNNNVDTQLGAEGSSQLQTGDLQANLQSAYGVLWQNYLGDAQLNPYATGYVQASSESSGSSLDMQVALAQGGSDLVASQRDDYQLGTGSYQPSVLIAQGGNDTLDGSGNANDALIGDIGTDLDVEVGTDTFIVGSGNDYIVAGTGSALIGGALSGEGIGGMGKGNDTVVLGDPKDAKSFGQDTVWAGTWPETFYVAPGDNDVIHLALGSQPNFEVVKADGSVTPLDINATALVGGTPGTYLDAADDALVTETPNADGTYTVKVMGLGAGSGSSSALALHADALGGSAHALATPAGTGSFFAGELELDNFQGTSDAVITLNNGTTTTPGAGNLGNFSATAYSDHTEYRDLSGTGGGDSIEGVNTAGANYNILGGEGNASYLYAGDGNYEVFAEFDRRSLTSDASNDLVATFSLLQGCIKSKLECNMLRRAISKLLVATVGMLCASSAMAMSYHISQNYETPMCTAVKDAFAEGFVLDATQPLCERRFKLSPKAKALGLWNVDKKLLPRSTYSNLFKKIIAVTGGEKRPQSEAFKVQNAAAAERLMKWNIKLYSSDFDADNSGKIRIVYIEDFTYCADRDSYPNGSVTTYIQQSDGSLNPTWGVRNATAGIPFMYENHTYYMTWISRKGGVNKNTLAEIDIYDASPYEGVFTQISSYNAFPPPYCVIYQTKTRTRP